jgi:hypothetical protein
MPVTPAPASRSTTSCRLAISIRLQAEGPAVASEEVTEADLLERVSETWWQGFLRKGRPATRLEDLEARVTPIRDKTGGRSCLGFYLEAVGPDGWYARSLFSYLSFQDVAQRAASRLVEARVIEPEQTVYFELLAEADPEGAAARPRQEGDACTFETEIITKPLEYVEADPEPLLEKARHVVPPGRVANDAESLVFYTATALEKLERFARKGESLDPPVETGAVLLGVLCSSPRSGDMFCVVEDAIEASETESSTFSLSFSSGTWMRIQAVLKARQCQPQTRAQRILGHGHGHPFPPSGCPSTCASCKAITTCDRHTAFLSSFDRRWARAVFPRQPWQISHVYGVTPRGEKVDRLFGLRDGRLTERGFHVIDSFDHPGTTEPTAPASGNSRRGQRGSRIRPDQRKEDPRA